jgi:hypothetical protein
LASGGKVEPLSPWPNPCVTTHGEFSVTVIVAAALESQVLTELKQLDDLAVFGAVKYVVHLLFLYFLETSFALNFQPLTTLFIIYSWLIHIDMQES